MPRYEQLGRNLTNCFIRHTNCFQGGPERNGSRNGLWHRHTIAGRILRTSEAIGQLGIRESFNIRVSRHLKQSSSYLVSCIATHRPKVELVTSNREPLIVIASSTHSVHIEYMSINIYR